MQKRGLSDVVVSVLIVLLSIAAVIIIWAFIRLIISQKTDIGVITASFSIPNDKVSARDSNNDQVIDEITFTIVRDVGKAELAAYNVILESADKVRCVIRVTPPLDELGAKRFTVNKGTVCGPDGAGPYSYNIADVKRIAVAPIIKLQNGKESTGREFVSYSFS